MTAEQYQEVLKSSQKELFEAKRTWEKDLKNDYDRATREAQQKAYLEHEQKLQDERNRNLEIKRQIEYDKHLKKNCNFKIETQRWIKFIVRLIIYFISGTIDQIKRKAWEEKKTDTTNLEFSQKIYHDKVKAEAEFTNSVVKAKKDYYGDLSKQDFQNKQMSELQSKILNKKYLMST